MFLNIDFLVGCGESTSELTASFDSSSIIEETYSEFASISSFRETTVKSA